MTFNLVVLVFIEIVAVAVVFIAAAGVYRGMYGRFLDKKLSLEPEKEPCEWFEVESVEDLGRKIHAGIVLLNRQARSEKWDDRKKDAFIRASRHIEAAHYVQLALSEAKKEPAIANPEILPCKCGCKWFVFMDTESKQYSSPTSFEYINNRIGQWPKCD